MDTAPEETTGTAPAWQRRLTAPAVDAVSVAPADRTAGLVTIVEGSGTSLHAWDVPTGTTRRVVTPPAILTANTTLGHDGRHAYVLADDGGNELGHLTAVPVRHHGPALDLTPSLGPYTLRGVGVSRTGAGLVLIAVDGDGYHLYHLARPDVPDPAPRRLLSSPHETWNCLLSADGGVATVDTTEHNPGRRTFAVRAVAVADGTVLDEFHDPGHGVEAHLFSPVAGDPSIAVVTDRSGWRRPVLWRPADGTRRRLNLDELPGDLLPVDWSDDGRTLLLCQTHRAAQRLLSYRLDTDRWQLLDLPAGSCHGEQTKGAHFGPGCFFAADQAVLAAVESLATPMAVHRLEPGAQARVVLDPATVPPGRPARSVDVRSSDGTMVQGWLATPEGTGPFPAVIHVHGGPHGVWLDAFRPEAQMWLDHGYAYLALNYRGSTTFGTAYKEAVWGDIGHWEVEDIAAARQWLVEQRIADPRAVLLTGASYGGFLTLYAMSVLPDRWAGGIAEIALADWMLAYQDANPAIRAAMATWLGGTPEQVPERYRDRSPLTHLADLTAPVLIRQGRRDTRTPARQMEVYQRRARQLGRPVTVQWEESGHEGVKDRLAFFRQALEFAADCLARSAARD